MLRFFFMGTKRHALRETAYFDVFYTIRPCVALDCTKAIKITKKHQKQPIKNMMRKVRYMQKIRPFLCESVSIFTREMCRR